MKGHRLEFYLFLSISFLFIAFRNIYLFPSTLCLCDSATHCEHKILYEFRGRQSLHGQNENGNRMEIKLYTDLLRLLKELEMIGNPTLYTRISDHMREEKGDIKKSKSCWKRNLI
jgi:hypothetical protein